MKERYRERREGSVLVSYRVIGRNIRAARKRKALTQERAAEALGISTLQFGRMERGCIRISLERLVQISELTNAPVSVLLNGSMASEPFAPPRAPEESPVISEITDLSRGCSERTLSLMLECCRVICMQDKVL